MRPRILTQTDRFRLVEPQTSVCAVIRVTVTLVLYLNVRAGSKPAAHRVYKVHDHKADSLSKKAYHLSRHDPVRIGEPPGHQYTVVR